MSDKKEKHNDDWSGRHVRIRFEMVLSALAFFIFARYGVTEIRLPLIGTKSEINDSFLLWAALAFSIFSIISLLTRSHYEKMRWPKEELSNKEEIDTFINDFREIKTIANKLDLDTNSTIKGTLTHLVDAADDIQKLNLRTNRFLGFLSDLHHENGLDSPVHPKFWAKTVPIMATVNSASNIIFKNSQKARALENLKTNLDTGASKVRNIAVLEHVKLLDGLSVLTPELEQREKALRRIARTKALQREVLSYGLPILTSFILILFGLHGKFCS